MRQMIVHCEHETIQMALIEDGRLAEFAVERSREESVVGSFYKGRVVNVLPGMQAAFVDIGLKKNAFLYIDDVLHPHLEKQPKQKPSISQLLTVGQELTVQVMKEPRGGKGARVTTHFSLPGRCMVYMPTADYVAVSKKIGREAERARLKSIGEQLRTDEEGIIIRTVSEDEPLEFLSGDLEYLRKEWTRILEKAESSSAPALLHRDLGLLQRFIRDSFDPLHDELVIDSLLKGEETKSYLKETVPGMEPKVTYHTGGGPIFQAYGLDEQMKAGFARKITLPEGVTIVVDQTEAMTIMDVNTAKYIGGDNFEETVLKTNLMAAQQIARTLRLWDIGGIIIVDFIDMDREEHRQQVVSVMEAVMRKDRTKSFVVGWTKLGLLEMTRKKARENSSLPFAKPCVNCGGKGIVVE
ncbi:Rne/Rng family ribonuclease [Paenibacillus glucanolyticus]|uniref:Rne/Rng family ribonuclease n=1 Tax=Paenibacillus TaxID=44249 RepID=UPI00096FB447|nr:MULTISPECIES: Rne/Rng family ribonuclease [Paenibacillus]MDH6674801.1 ribonuclease G [Paenibacillus sp. LBL]OMF72250.1 ribonuclease E/G [Paenibacillus glucanolyticus]